MRSFKKRNEPRNSSKTIPSNEANQSLPVHTNKTKNNLSTGHTRSKHDFGQIPLHNAGTVLQPKLSVNNPGDKYEQEADAMANKVTQTNNEEKQPKSKSISSTITPLIQTKGEVSASSINSVLDNKIAASRGRGTNMDNNTRSFMSGRFGADFSNVKIHTDNEAAKMNNELSAKAFTVGKDIYFNAGEFNPQSNQGKQLLAHELTHVLQQNKVSGQSAGLQRDDDTESSDARLNFKNDWENFFSHYNKLIRVDNTAAIYDKKQKKGITAVKNDDAITVTLGRPYVTEQDEQIRLKWIKAAIIDNFVKADRFEELGYDPTHSKLDQLNPPNGLGAYCRLNCPATAASLGEYLKTGTINKAFCDTSLETVEGFGFDISKNKFTKTLDWKKAKATMTRQLKKHGDFVIVEATRSAKQMADNNVAETHYFTVVNIHEKLFAIDAFAGGIVKDDIDLYNNTRVIATSYRLVIGEFKVTPVIPKH